MLSLLFALIAATPEFGPSDPAKAGITTVPLTYIMAYGGNVVDNAEMLRELHEAPPNVLHIGHGVPLNSIFGPAADFSGWNPELVPAQEILDRRATLRKFTDEVRQAGVDRVICYINPSILGGDHEKRLGFFAFYDHWDDYREALGLGPKPERGPEQWMQKERGSFKPWEPYPNYPLWRYEPCMNEPAWEAYERVVVRLIAESGYDGIFVDDCIQECRHDLCRQQFPKFLRQRYSPETLSAVLHGDSSMADEESMDRLDPVQRLRHANTYWFWQQTVARFVGDMAQTGQSVRPDFFCVPNWGAISRVKGAAGRARSGKNAGIWNQASRYMMFEEAHPAGYFGVRGAFGYLLQYLYGLSIDVRPVVISYGTSRRHLELGYAECAAGSGGAFVQPGAEYPEIRKAWRKFYEQNQDLFQGFRLAAPVGLVLSYDELCFGNDHHLRQALATAYALMEQHVPMAVVTKEQLATVQPSELAILILPDVQYLSEEQLGGVRSYLQQGGAVLSDGKCGAHDLFAQPRTPDTLAFLGATPSEGPAPKAIHVESLDQLVPKRAYDVIAALDILDAAPFNARLKEIGAQPELPTEANRLGVLLDQWAGRKLALAEGAPELRTTFYRRFDGEKGDLLVHAVRYAAPIEGGENSSIAAAPLALRVPLPPGWAAKEVWALAPGREPVVLKAASESGVLACELPPFEFYSLLHVKIERVSRSAAP